MTAMTRSASMTPSSMSLASSEASLTLCSGTLRTSIGAGTAVPLGSTDFRCRKSGSGGQYGAGVVTRDGVSDVFQGGDHGAPPTSLDETERGIHLGAHAAAGELPGGR